MNHSPGTSEVVISNGNALFVQFRTRMYGRDLAILSARGTTVSYTQTRNKTIALRGKMLLGLVLQCRTCKTYFIWNDRAVAPGLIRCPGCRATENTPEDLTTFKFTFEAL